MLLIIVFILLFIITLFFYYFIIFLNRFPDSSNICLDYNKLYYYNEEITINNLDDYIKHVETINEYVKPESLKEIVWYKNNKIKQKYSIIYIHGYLDDKKDGYKLVNELSLLINANVYFMRFKPDGCYNKENSYDFISVYTYLREMYNSLIIGNILGENIILVSYSNGSNYGIWSTCNFYEKFNIICNVFFSPNLKPRYKHSKIITEISNLSIVHNFIILIDKIFPLNNYQKVSSKSLSQMIGILNINKKYLNDFNDIPFILFCSRYDEFVSFKAIYDFYITNNNKKENSLYINFSDKHNIICFEKYHKFFLKKITNFVNNIEKKNVCNEVLIF